MKVGRAGEISMVYDSHGAIGVVCTSGSIAACLAAGSSRYAQTGTLAAEDPANGALRHCGCSRVESKNSNSGGYSNVSYGGREKAGRSIAAAGKVESSK